MVSDGVTKLERRGASMISLGLSLETAHRTLQISRFAHVLFRSLAPIRRIMRRRKLLLSFHPNNFYSKFSEHERKVPSIEGYRKAKLGLVESQGSLGASARARGETRAARKHQQFNASLVAAVSHTLQIQPTVLLKKVNLFSSAKTSGVTSTVVTRQYEVPWRNPEEQALWRKQPSNAISSTTHNARLKPLPRLKTASSGSALNRGIKQDGITKWQEKTRYKTLAKLALKLSSRDNPEAQHSISPSRTMQAGRHVDVHHDQLQNRPLTSVTHSNTVHQGQAPHSYLMPEKIEIGRVVRDLLTANVRRPPSGVAAFDTRSAPIWPGRKPAF